MYPLVEVVFDVAIFVVSLVGMRIMLAYDWPKKE